MEKMEVTGGWEGDIDWVTDTETWPCLIMSGAAFLTGPSSMQLSSDLQARCFKMISQVDRHNDSQVACNSLIKDV